MITRIKNWLRAIFPPHEYAHAIVCTEVVDDPISHHNSDSAFDVYPEISDFFDEQMHQMMARCMEQYLRGTLTFGSAIVRVAYDGKTAMVEYRDPSPERDKAISDALVDMRERFMRNPLLPEDYFSGTDKTTTEP